MERKGYDSSKHLYSNHRHYPIILFLRYQEIILHREAQIDRTTDVKYTLSPIQLLLR